MLFIFFRQYSAIFFSAKCDVSYSANPTRKLWSVVFVVKKNIN